MKPNKTTKKEQIKSLNAQLKAADSKARLRRIAKSLDDDTVDALLEHFTFKIPWPNTPKNRGIRDILAHELIPDAF